MRMASGIIATLAMPPMTEHSMQFLLLVYIDDTLLNTLPQGEFDRLM